tara:strand:- start:840 stop:1814 length:975 start_codon:yes stop_codon:yes gene_type:complete
MRKIIYQLFLILIISFYSQNKSFSDYYKIGQEIEGEFRFTKKISFPLEPGIWTVVRKDGWFYGDIRVRMIGIALLDGNEIVAMREFQEGLMSASWQSAINTSLHRYFYIDKYDGCYERTEYTVVKVKNEGSFTNCFRVAHMDVRKEIYTPDDPEGVVWTKNYRKFIKDNNIQIPEIMLWSWHGFFSRTVSNNLYTAAYMDNPEYFEGPAHQFATEETSEYHPSNIGKYPKFKKYMEEFVKISAKRHIDFEKDVGAKRHHELDFSSIGLAKNKKNRNRNKKEKKSVNSSKSSKDIVQQLNDLKKLLDSGVITKKEFEKAKKKILN